MRRPPKELETKRYNVPKAQNPIGRVGRRLQPQILNAINGFERLPARKLRLFAADVGKRSSHDAYLVAGLAPFASEIKRPIFHAMFQRACIVVDVKYIHTSLS